MKTKTPLTPHVGVEIDGISSDDLVSASGAECRSKQPHHASYTTLKGVEAVA